MDKVWACNNQCWLAGHQQWKLEPEQKQTTHTKTEPEFVCNSVWSKIFILLVMVTCVGLLVHAGHVDLDLISRSQQYQTGSMAVYACRLLWCVKGDEGGTVACSLWFLWTLSTMFTYLLAPGIRPTWCWTEWAERSSTLTLATALRWPWRGRSFLRRYPSVSPACWSTPWRSESAPLASLSLLLIEMSSS